MGGRDWGGGWWEPRGLGSCGICFSSQGTRDVIVRVGVVHEGWGFGWDGGNREGMQDQSRSVAETVRGRKGGGTEGRQETRRRMVNQRVETLEVGRLIKPPWLPTWHTGSAIKSSPDHRGDKSNARYSDWKLNASRPNVFRPIPLFRWYIVIN